MVGPVEAKPNPDKGRHAMLSYRHGFHAGNAGDVLKHATLAAALSLLTRKDKPLCYLESHAGAGRYDLAAARAQKTGEHRAGIARIWDRNDAPGAVQPYLQAVRAENPDGVLRCYPGSPAVAAALMRPCDRLLLVELNGKDGNALRAAFHGDPRVGVHQRDGYEGLVALVPPHERRGFALLDPSYEVESDYADVVRTVAAAHARWPGGCYAIWYPLLERPLSRRLERALVATGLRRILCSELTIDRRDGPGMKGAGMLWVSPPYNLDAALREMLPWLARTLAHEGPGLHRLEWLVGE
jgi:23S rRNA (adenine2030-N6)-methyltransferase